METWETEGQRLADIAKEELEDKVYESFDELTYDQQYQQYQNCEQDIYNIYDFDYAKVESLGKNVLECKNLSIDLICELMVMGAVKNCESAYKFNKMGLEYKALNILGVDEDNVENALKFDSSIKVKILQTLTEKIIDNQKEALITTAYNYLFGNNSELPIAEKPEDIALKINESDIKYAGILQLINSSVILEGFDINGKNYYKAGGEACFDSLDTDHNFGVKYDLFDDFSLTQLLEDCYYNDNCSSTQPEYQEALTCINTVKSIVLTPFMTDEEAYETCWVYE